MPSLLNVSNSSSKPEEFSLKGIEVPVDSEGQNWLKRVHVGKLLGLVNIHRSTAKLPDKDHKTRTFLQAEGGCQIMTPTREDAQDHDIFISLPGVLYVSVNSRKDKGKALKKHILEDIVPHGFDARIEEIQKKHRQAIEEKTNAAIALLNDDLKNREYENAGLQVELREKDQQIAVLKKPYVGYLVNEDKYNGITIIAKSNEEAEYSYISVCGQHGYRRHKVRVLLACNECSTLFAEGDTPNTIVLYNFWQEHRLIVVDPNMPRHFRLDAINREQLLALNNA